MEQEEKEILIGNVTTAVNTISLMIAGVIFGVITAFGLKLPFDQYSLAGVIGLLIMTGFSYLNAKYKNTYFDEDKDTLTIDVSNLTDAQVNAIKGFVENAGELNTVNVAGKTFNRYNDSQIFDNDAPVLNDEYNTVTNEDEGC